MNKYLLIAFLSLGISLSYAQNNFSDDIESYSLGSYIGASSPNWRVWSAAGEGTAEDALVTDEVAHSGKQSVRCEAGTPSQGPMDLVLPFGGEKNVGTFTYTMWVYVTADNAAYWNFQAKATIGTTWAVDNYITADGRFFATLGSASTGQMCNVAFPHEQWNKYTLVANLTRNEWEILINDVSAIKFANPNNTIASIDIFPLYNADTGGSSSLFYVDDVSYDYQPYVLKQRDAGLITLNMKNRFIENESSGGSIQIRNLGTTAITSIEMQCAVDNGTPFTATASNLNVASLGFATLNIQPVAYKRGTSQIKCNITKVNGSADDETNNDSKTADLFGVTPAANKMIVTEEATGTWCTWCPRGHVYMDSMLRTYPKYWVGVAVHNGSGSTVDPMTVPNYVNWMLSYPGFSGYPSIINNRVQLTDPLTIESDFYNYITTPTPVILTNGAKYNAATKELEISVKGDFVEDISGDYRFNLVVIEDNVQFPGTGYRQVNSYANNARGWMGGFEKLPNPVPANRMVYNHVARAIFDDAVGLQGYLPSTIKKGSTYYITYSYTLADTFKPANIRLVGLLYGPNGEVINATKTTIDQAVANGLYSSTENPSPVIKYSQLSPNPANENSNLELELTQDAEVEVQVLDLTGKLVTSRNYGQLNGNLVLPINTQNFENGSYFIKLRINDKISTRKLVVTH